MRGTVAWLRGVIVGNRVWRSIVRHGYPDTPLDQSLAVFSNFFLHVHPVKVHRHTLRPTYTFGLGLMAFYLFVVLVISGMFLMFYYVPSVERAYADMKDLEFVVSFGIVLRNLHRWAAHGMVAVVFLHMCRVFYTGAYKPPREFNWVVGVVLLVLTLLLSFTGYLLPWDQLAFWAITVGTNMVGSAPVFGADSKFLLIGGVQVDQNALIRFYTLHVIGLPLLAAIFMAVHFWRIRRDGGLARPL